VLFAKYALPAVVRAPSTKRCKILPALPRVFRRRLPTGPLLL